MRRLARYTIPLVLVGAMVAVVVYFLHQQHRHPDTPGAPEQPTQQQAAADNMVYAQVRTVDLQGTPLAGMVPIATRQPNAFDPPIAKGPPTGEDGQSYVAFSADADLCVRAWDPSVRLFANNFFDVPHSTGGRTPVMTIVMVPGASLHLIVFTPDNTPAADAPVDLMLSHPTRGPWWPAKGTTDAQGAVTFPSLPAGSYVLDLRAGRLGAVELPVVNLPPGEETDLGTVVLQANSA